MIPLIFKESQKFTQWWLWLILLVAAVFPLYAVYKQLILGQPVGDKPAPDLLLIIIAALMLGVIVLFWIMELRTEIDREQIRMHFYPFVKKQVNWSDIQRAEVVDYGFVGGWGIRLGTKYGTVYNVRGREGLAIEVSKGRKFLIGTQRPAELAAAIQKIRN